MAHNFSIYFDVLEQDATKNAYIELLSLRNLFNVDYISVPEGVLKLSRFLSCIQALENSEKPLSFDLSSKDEKYIKLHNPRLKYKFVLGMKYFQVWYKTDYISFQ